MLKTFVKFKVVALFPFSSIPTSTPLSNLCCNNGNYTFFFSKGYVYEGTSLLLRQDLVIGCTTRLWLGYFLQNNSLMGVRDIAPTFTSTASTYTNITINNAYVYYDGWKPTTPAWKNMDGCTPTQFLCQYRPSIRIYYALHTHLLYCKY